MKLLIDNIIKPKYWEYFIVKYRHQYGTVKHIFFYRSNPLWSNPYRYIENRELRIIKNSIYKRLR